MIVNLVAAPDRSVMTRIRRSCCPRAYDETLPYEDDEGTHDCCGPHGLREEIPYRMRKAFQVTLGGISRTGFRQIEDAMRLLASMAEEQQSIRINSILDEISVDEESDDDE